MSTPFTPGPWGWVKADCGGWELHAPSGRVHSDGSACDEYGADIDVHGPDARLIAAAPEMYEALKAVLADKGLNDLIAAVGEGDPPFWAQVKAALAKAEQEDQETSR